MFKGQTRGFIENGLLARQRINPGTSPISGPVGGPLGNIPLHTSAAYQRKTFDQEFPRTLMHNAIPCRRRESMGASPGLSCAASVNVPDQQPNFAYLH